MSPAEHSCTEPDDYWGQAKNKEGGKEERGKRNADEHSCAFGSRCRIIGGRFTEFRDNAAAPLRDGSARSVGQGDQRGKLF